MASVVVAVISGLALVGGAAGIAFGVLLKLLASDAKRTATVRSSASFEHEQEDEQ